MKKHQTELQADVKDRENDDNVEELLAAMENLMRQEKAQETCVILPLHDLMKGPKHVAESIIREQEQKDGKEDIDR